MKFSLLTVAMLGLAVSAAPVEEEYTIEKRQSINTQNDVKSGVCKGTILIFARGTTEGGNMGSIIGPPLVVESKKLVPDLAVQGVDYAADIPGYLAGGDNKGAKTMADLITSAASKCPTAKIITSGYSQGGQVTRKAIDLLTPDVKARVSGVLIFGDPLNGKPINGIEKSKMKIYCAEGDMICQGLPLPIGPHLSYGKDALTAAQWVASVAA